MCKYECETPHLIPAGDATVDHDLTPGCICGARVVASRASWLKMGVPEHDCSYVEHRAVNSIG